MFTLRSTDFLCIHWFRRPTHSPTYSPIDFVFPSIWSPSSTKPDMVYSSTISILSFSFFGYSRFDIWLSMFRQYVALWGLDVVFLFFNFLFFGCRVVGWFNLFNFGLFPVFVVVRWDPVVFGFCFLLRGLFPFLMILSSTFYNPLSSLFNYSFSNGGFYYRTTYDETP